MASPPDSSKNLCGDERIKLRLLSKLSYHDTTKWLCTLRSIEYEVSASDSAYAVRALRTNGLKRWRESREVALFLEGVEQRFGIETRFASVEEDDFDAVARWSYHNTDQFCLLQVKELPPAEVNPAVSIQKVINDLARYCDSEKLTVAIHLNRTLSDFSFSQLDIPKLNLAGLWVFFSATEDQSRWTLVGDLLGKDPMMSSFLYPQASQLSPS